MTVRDRQQRTACQAHQVVRVRKGRSFIKVVHAPDETPFHIPPGAEVFDVQVAYGKNLGSLICVRTYIRPDLHPAVEGGAQKGKHSFRHPFVLQAQIGLDHRGMRLQPILVTRCGLDDIHRGAGMYDSGMEMGCQSEECDRRLVLKFEISMRLWAAGESAKRSTVVLGVRSLRSLRSKIFLRLDDSQSSPNEKGDL